MLQKRLPGVGPRTAASIVDVLGMDTVAVLNSENAVAQLLKVSGIGKAKVSLSL